MKVRKGFTLVELLIVIIIIGILASAMLLSSGSATDAAEASNVISDLRSLKSAALLLFIDSYDSIGGEDLTMTLLARYVDNPEKISGGNYEFTRADDGRWWVGFDMSASNKTPGVRSKVQARAEDVGLYSETELITANVYKGEAAMVWMVAR